MEAGSIQQIGIYWRLRDVPLAPVAVCAQGTVAAALRARLLRLPDAALARLRGVAGQDLLIVMGAAADLPWVDGVIYLGRDARAAQLLMPTTQEPNVPAPLLERALLARHRDQPPPLAVLHEPPMVISLALAAPVARTSLDATEAPADVEMERLKAEYPLAGTTCHQEVSHSEFSVPHSFEIPHSEIRIPH
ncbi:MAG: hypothetical protein ACKV2V_16220 [Blastocatellia bacterium]